MTLDLNALLTVAIGAVDISRKILRESPLTSHRMKSDRDFVSNLDYAIERALRDYLSDQTPEIGFLGEEEGGANIEPGQPYWAVDPVDGTSNLLHGLPLCGTAVGLTHDGQAVLGVIDLPYLEERFHAASRIGSFLNGQSISASATRKVENAVIAIGDYATGDRSRDKNALRFRITEELAARAERVRMLGSAAVDLAWVAAGRLDGSIMLANKAWETPAGVVIAREAGVRVTDLDGSEHTATSTATVTAAPGVADELLALLADLTDN